MKKTILLPTRRFEGSPSEDTQIRVNFESEQNVLRNTDRDVILNLSQQFFDEKNSCNNYKIFGKMKMIFRNINSSIEIGYPYLTNKLSLISNHTNKFEGYLPYDEFAFIRKDVHSVYNTGKTLNSLTGFTGFALTTIGGNTHKNISTMEKDKYNWNLYLSYVYSGDTNFSMKYTLSGITTPLEFKSGEGIPFRVNSYDKYYVLTSPVKHGMEQGEFIIINNTLYNINSVGNEIYNSEFYVINILKNQFKTGVNLGDLVTGKRCIDYNNSGYTTSEYYVRKHKTLTSVDDYRMDNIGFETPIFEDEKKIINKTSDGDENVLIERNRMESVIYDFIKPLVVTGLTNNLGYTPTEVYLTTIFRNGNGYFNYPPKVGYSFHFHDSWIDKHFSGTTTNETNIPRSTFSCGTYNFTSGDELPKYTILIGDFVEYIPTEMKERVISESYHKITSKVEVFDHGQTGNTYYYGAEPENPTGLYYQTHHAIKLRELSPYVETSNTNNITNLPDNVKYFPNEKLWKWRDKYDLGYVDDSGNGVDFSYMNDILYVHKDINFYLRNETVFTNKKDGVKKFKNITMSLINC